MLCILFSLKCVIFLYFFLQYSQHFITHIYSGARSIIFQQLRFKSAGLLYSDTPKSPDIPTSHRRKQPSRRNSQELTIAMKTCTLLCLCGTRTSFDIPTSQRSRYSRTWYTQIYNYCPTVIFTTWGKTWSRIKRFFFHSWYLSRLH